MPKVLLVEDNALSRKMLDRQLQHCGYTVVVAVDGDQGVALALEQQPDLIIMDTDLPVMDGWQAIKILKASAATAKIPVIALTTRSKTGNWKTALEVGCNDYDTKPIVFKRLLGKAKALLSASDEAPATSLSPDALESKPSGISPVPAIPALAMVKKNRPGLLNKRYQIVQKLDSNFYGDRFLANDLNAVETETVIINAFELPTDNLALLDLVRDFFAKEMSFLKVISRQDNIATCLDFFEEGNIFYWVQAHIVGQSLITELDSAQSMGYVLQLTHSLLSNIHPFHQGQLVHYACHPQSFILQQSDQRVVLVEYGILSRLFISLRSKSLAYRQALLRQRAYQTAEHRVGNPQPSSDIYSIGMIVLQALTGQSPEWLVANMGKRSLTDMVNADPKIIRLFERMVNPNQQLRFTSAGEALAALPLGLIPKKSNTPYRQAFSS
ncbi:MAG: response regulator [Cyanobacteria bacterium P01_D01_bin.156]